MSNDPIRLTVRCPWRIHLEVDAEDHVRVKCRDCSRKQGRPVYHEITLADLRDRIGTTTFPESDAEERAKAA